MSELIVPITRGEYDDFKKYEVFFHAFMDEKITSVLYYPEYIKEDGGFGYDRGQAKVYYNSEAVKHIESIALEQKNKDIDVYKLVEERLRMLNDKLRNRTLIQRILNK